jgi:hypothetical protein
MVDLFSPTFGIFDISKKLREIKIMSKLRANGFVATVNA